jgi:hypothetical protein
VRVLPLFPVNVPVAELPPTEPLTPPVEVEVVPLVTPVEDNVPVTSDTASALPASAAVIAIDAMLSVVIFLIMFVFVLSS